MAAFSYDNDEYNFKLLPAVGWDKERQEKKLNEYDPKDVATQFSNRVLVNDDRDEILREIFGWCDENIGSRYQYDVIDFFSKPHIRYMRMVSFAKKEDAMAFKLTFG